MFYNKTVSKALDEELRVPAASTRVNHADDVMARITAERLVQHLEASGSVPMKGPPRVAPTTGGMPPGRGSGGGGA